MASMGRKRKPISEKAVGITITMRPEQLQRIKLFMTNAQAGHVPLNRSEMIRSIVGIFLDQYERPNTSRRRA